MKILAPPETHSDWVSDIVCGCKARLEVSINDVQRRVVRAPPFASADGMTQELGAVTCEVFYITCPFCRTQTFVDPDDKGKAQVRPR